MMKYVLWSLLAGMLITTSCLKSSSGSSTTTCNYDPCQQKVVPDTQLARLETYLSSKNITAVKHCSGMYYNIINPGTGASPTPCSSVIANYVGSFANDSVFEKSPSPVFFDLRGVIQGWGNGLPLIKKGGKIKLYLPPALAYGTKGSADGVIPGSAILIFDIELVDIP